MQVEIVGITQPLGKYAGMTSDQMMAAIARVSNPKNQKKLDTMPKLLKHCLDEKHVSVFEQADMTVEIVTSRAISAQIIRHRSFCFQEFCIDGDSEIYFETPCNIRKNKKVAKKIKIKELYKRWNKNSFSKSRIQNMKIRVFDTNKNEFVFSHINEIKKTGVKPVFKINFKNGKTIQCTKEHKFLTPDGFLSLEESVGLCLIGTKAVINKNCRFASNGVPAYQNYEWLSQAKTRCIELKTGLIGIANEAGCSYHTIRKWLKKLNLNFTKSEVASYTLPWNKNIFGYKNKSFSEETRSKMRSSAKKGKDSNLWKGGVDRAERLKVQDHIHKYRNQIYKKYNYCCNNCGCSGKLELHHVVPVYQNKDLAYNIENIVPLCKICHKLIHNKRGDKNYYPKGNHKLSIKWTEIESVEYIGERETYDLEVDHASHNYIANGMVVHNSQRYASPEEFELAEARRQDKENRQSSIDDLPEEIKSEFLRDQYYLWEQAKELYDYYIDVGVAKECARFLLPISTQTTINMKGSVRSWIHYLQTRTDPSTQKEHREIAEKIKEIFIVHFPITSEALGWINTSNDSNAVQ
jgi:thymidylate synthase (FAD)